MIEKLQAIAERYNQVEEDLSNPAVISDMKKYTALNKEYKDLKQLVDKYHEYKNLLDNIANSKELVETETDPEMQEMAREELAELEPQVESLETEIKHLLIPKDPEDSNNVILEIRAGTGGDEASLFAGDLYRMYQRYASIRGWRIELNDMQEGKVGGINTLTATIIGEDAYGTMKYESGVHRVQRVPATETQGRVHTSAATVACMPEMEEVDIDIKDSDLRIDTFCSSGPGGQSVNTTYSAVRITHIPTNTVVSNQDEKSQIKNKAKALRILKSRLYDIEMQKKLEEQSRLRKTFVSTGDRSAKIRTYNFPQGRVTDHRVNLTLYNLQGILNGDLEEIIETLRIAENSEKMKAGLTL